MYPERSEFPLNGLDTIVPLRVITWSSSGSVLWNLYRYLRFRLSLEVITGEKLLIGFVLIRGKNRLTGIYYIPKNYIAKTKVYVADFATLREKLNDK